MSEKRHRHEQRRRRRKARRSGPRQDPGRAATREIADRLGRIAEISAGDARELVDGLDAEQWASYLIGTMCDAAMPGADVEAVLAPRFVDALERLGEAGALATLRALAAVTRPEHARLARAAADRLAAAGAPEPAWAGDVGTARPTSAVLIAEDAFDDGAGVLVEFSGSGAPTHTLGVYIDHNLGGLVKHVLLAGPVASIRADAERATEGALGMAVRDLDLGEARARIEWALEALDETYDPPVSEDVRAMRAFVEARLRALPAGFQLPAEDVPPGPEEREALMADFLTSPEGERWGSDDDAADVVELAIDFGSDYNHGGPLRWSPVVVDVFMTSWLPRKVLNERAFFERAAVVLPDWVAYAGRRRGVPEHLVREAVENVATCRDPMLEAVDDPSGCDAAKAIGLAALDAGVDLTDPDELARFVEHYDDGLAA